MGNLNPYLEVKQLAAEKRLLYGVTKYNIGLKLLRDIFRTEKINIHLIKERPKALRAAYFNDENGCDVLLFDGLPKEAKIFSLSHELKHHYLDKDNLKAEAIVQEYGAEPLIEKTAEVFAAEFIWPENEFYEDAVNFGLKTSCTNLDVVNFKRDMDMPVSYKFITKRLEWLKFIDKGQFSKEHFQKLEWSVFGKPWYLTRRIRIAA